MTLSCRWLGENPDCLQDLAARVDRVLDQDGRKKRYVVELVSLECMLAGYTVVDRQADEANVGFGHVQCLMTT